MYACFSAWQDENCEPMWRRIQSYKTIHPTYCIIQLYLLLKIPDFTSSNSSVIQSCISFFKVGSVSEFRPLWIREG